VDTGNFNELKSESRHELQSERENHQNSLNNGVDFVSPGFTVSSIGGGVTGI